MKIENCICKQLSEDEITSLTRGAKLVALRWDLVEWGLVLDLDVPLREGKEAPIYRVWLVFRGVSEISFPLENTRLPNGCFLSSYMSIEKKVGGFEDYSFSALLPTYDLSGNPLRPVTKSIVIRAKEVNGLSSVKTAIPDNFGFLTRETRLGLATDQEMLNAFFFC
jgi:hypothetical protein